MRKAFIISLAVMLICGLNPALAAKKTGKADKPDRPTAPKLAKVPDKLTSAVKLKGDESPEQLLKAYTDGIISLVPLLSTNDLPNLQKLEITVHQASRPGAEKERLACSQAMAAITQTDVSLEARVRLVKLLTDTGKAEAVPALTKLLDDKEEQVREAVRCALQNNPSDEAIQALRSALDKANEPRWTSGLILALATRKDADSVETLAKLATGKDDTVAKAALDGLALIGDKKATKVLQDILASGPVNARWIAAAEAYICTETADVRQMSEKKYPPQISYTALNKLLEELCKKSATPLLSNLKGADYGAREIALGQIRNLSPKTRKELIKGMDTLPDGMKAIVLESLANLGEKAVLPLALDFAKSADPEMHAAGLVALGRLGDESVVTPLCLSLAAATNGAERAQIEQILTTLTGGKDADKALIDAMKKNTGDAKRTLISVLSKRNCHNAFSALLAETDNPDSVTARTAFQALGNVASPENAAVMVQKLADIKKSDIRGEAENSAARVLAKVEKASARTDVVLPIMDKTADIDARGTILRLLRISGDARALETVKAALQDNEQRIRDTAIRTLGEWPDDSAWTALSDVYNKPEKEAHRVLALRGLVRLATGTPDKPNPKMLERCTQLMASTAKDEDRKLILSGLSNVKEPAAIKAIAPLLSEPGVKAEARLAMKRVAEAIKKKHPKESSRALELLEKAEK